MEEKRRWLYVGNTCNGVVSHFGFTIYSLANFLTKYPYMAVLKEVKTCTPREAQDLHDHLFHGHSIYAYMRPLTEGKTIVLVELGIPQEELDRALGEVPK